MECAHCRRKAFFFQLYSGQHLCEHHFTLDVERKAKKTIRQNGWIRPGDRIAVVMDGDAVCMALLHLLTSVFSARRDLSFILVTDENMINNREGKYLAEMIRQKSLKQVCVSFRDEGVITASKAPPEENVSYKHYPVFLRERIQRIAQEEYATRIAVGSTLDDEAYEMITAVLQGNISRLIPSNKSNVIPWIRPFVAVPAGEVRLYAHLHAGIRGFAIIPDSNCRPNTTTQTAVEEFTSRHPGTPFALANLKVALERTFLRDKEICSPSHQSAGNIFLEGKSTRIDEEDWDAV
jgi:tRNA(Ile)-lysidine synthase TilS/MesJ